MRQIRLSNHLQERLLREKGFFRSLLAFLTFTSWKKKVLREGIKGEETLNKKLREILSDEYIVFLGIPFKKGGDGDCFVIGPSGAYLFEVKNHRGIILYHEGRWVHKKIGSHGRIYDGENLKNPSKQLRRGIGEINNLLAREGLRVWIEGVVVFTHPEVDVLSDPIKDIRVLRVDEVETLFQGQRRRLSPKTVETVAGIIQREYGIGAAMG